MNYWLKPGPHSVKAEIIGTLVWFAFTLAFSRLIGMDTFQTVVMLLVIPAGQVVRYVWWHFRPYETPPPPPVTRYTRT